MWFMVQGWTIFQVKSWRDKQEWVYYLCRYHRYHFLFIFKGQVQITSFFMHIWMPISLLNYWKLVVSKGVSIGIHQEFVNSKHFYSCFTNYLQIPKFLVTRGYNYHSFFLYYRDITIMPEKEGIMVLYKYNDTYYISMWSYILGLAL